MRDNLRYYLNMGAEEDKLVNREANVISTYNSLIFLPSTMGDY
jgi:hypothetical protein